MLHRATSDTSLKAAPSSPKADFIDSPHPNGGRGGRNNKEMLAKREVGAAGSFLHSQGWEQLKDWEESRINLQPWLFLLFFQSIPRW